MPSGRTHDSITLWSLPLVAGITFERTHSSSVTLLVSSGFLFSGLMFGPDLDTYSQQYKRWGILRWIWLPYRKAFRHRSLWSHGLLIGTAIRIVYLLCWLILSVGLGGMVGLIMHQVVGNTADGQQWAQQWVERGWHQIGRSLQQHPGEWLGCGLGLELGSLSHTLSDWIGSTYKRWQKRRSRRQISSTPPLAITPEEILPPDLRPPERPSKPPKTHAPSPPPVSPPDHPLLGREPRLPTFKRPRKD